MKTTLLKLSCIYFSIYTGMLHSVPEGFNLKDGDASSPVYKDKTLVIESTRSSLIEWDSFSIDKGETVCFAQDNASHYVLNKVVGIESSRLLGNLESNGAVYLVNPNGILIGEEAHIQTAGFIASTLQLDWDLLQDNLLNFAGTSEAAIQHLGEIKTSAGNVIIIAQNIVSEGQIESNDGRTAILSALNAKICPNDSPEVWIRAENNGLDRDLMEENPYALGIAFSGQIESKEAYLVSNGKTSVSGSVNCPGETVHVLGQFVELEEGASIDVSSNNNGGKILIGGDFQGKNPHIPNALTTFVHDGVHLSANALDNGNGGKVIIWGNDRTAFYGSVEAKGGLFGGDGGFVEISGVNDLVFEGICSTLAPMGKTGTLLLDPSTMTISAGGTTATFSNPGCGVCNGNANTFHTTGASAVVNVTGLVTALATNNVCVTTCDGTGGTGSISVTSAISWANNTTLSLIADQGISITAAISNTSATTGFTAIDFRGLGTHTVNTIDGFRSTANISTVGGDINLYGRGSPNTAVTNGTLGIEITTTLSTTNGNITLEGIGGGQLANNTCCNAGISIGTISITGSGTLTATGTAGKGRCCQFGVNLLNLTMTNGDVTITGIGTAGSTQGFQPGIFAGAPITLNGSGNLVLDGTGGTGGTGGETQQGSMGVLLDTTSSVVSAIGASGSLTIIGTGGFAPADQPDPCIGIGVRGPITFSGSGSITLQGTGGSSQGGANEGVLIGDNISAASGNITIQGTKGSNTTSGVVLATPTITATAGNLSFVSGDATSTIDLGAATLSCGGEFSALGILTLSANQSITCGSAVFSSSTVTPSVEGKVDGPFSISLTTTGTVTIDSEVGGITPLTAFSFGAASALFLGNNFTLDSASFTPPPTTLTGNSDVSTTGGNVVLNTVNGDFDLSIASGGGTISAANLIGNTTPIGDLTLGGGAITFGTTVVTNNGSVTMSNPVTLSGASSITTTGGNIIFSSTVTGANTLSLSAGGGNITFGGIVGSTPLTSLSALTTGSGIITQSNTVTTTGAITYSTGSTGSILLSNNLTTSGGIVSITGPVSLQSAVTIDTTNGGGSAGAAISFIGSTSAITGAQALTLRAGTDAITLASSVGTAAVPLTSLNFNSGNTGLLTLGNGVSASSIELNNSAFAPPAAVLVSLAGDVTIHTGSIGANITFGNTLNGAHNLVLQSAGGNITLSGAVGNTTPLSSLQATATGVGTITQSSTVVTTGAITYTVGAGGSISLASNLTTTSGAVTITGPTSLTGSVSIDTTNAGGSAGAAIAFSGATTNITGAQTLSLRGGTGNITLGASVGTVGTPLTSLTFGAGDSGTLTLGNSSSASSVFLNNSSFIVPPSSPTILAGDMTVNTGNTGADVTFRSINGGFDLSIDAGTGDVTLAGVIGGTTPLGDLDILSGALVAIDDNITSNSFTIASAIPATFSKVGTTTINCNDVISFGGTIDSSTLGVFPDVTLDGSSGVTLNGNVGSTDRLGNIVIATGVPFLTLTANVDTIIASSFVIQPSAATTYSATPLLTITTSAANGNISFGGTLESPSNGNLTLNPGTGSITFLGSAGNTNALGAITITSATNVTASSSITAASLTQSAGSGTSTFSGAITTSGVVDLTGTAFTINGAVNAGNDVSITNTGLLSIGPSGDMDITGSFTQSGGGSVQTAGNISTASDNISFANAITLTGNVDWDTGGALGTVTASSSINGGFALDIEGQNIIFSAPVGASTSLSSLRAVAADTITVNGNQTVSTGPMTYDGTVVVTTNVTFTDAGINPMRFLVPTTVDLNPDVVIDSIVGNFDVTLRAVLSSITVEGNVDLSGSAGSNGGQFDALANTGITIGGETLTLGGSANPGSGGDGGDVTLAASLGSVSVHNINTSGGDGTVQNGDAGDISLQAASGYSGGFPIGKIILNQDLSASLDGNLVALRGNGFGASGNGGTITLSSNRSDPATVATITSSFSGNDMFIACDTFTMGLNEAMTILGDFQIAAPTVFLGDLVALRSLVILSTTTNLNLHGPYDILDNFGSLYSTPTLHFLGGDGFVDTGVLVPASGPVNEQDLGLSATTFRALLNFDGNILNFDTSPRPPTPTPSFSESTRRFLVYQLSIADAEFFDDLPLYCTPIPLHFLVKPWRFKEKYQDQLIERLKNKTIRLKCIDRREHL